MDGVNLSGDRPITLAILAMGGQGGGVLADWVVAMAEREGWVAQTTSVPGVAQRTGATIYYVELIRPRGNSLPVLSLMPVPGDVDVVVASELMEAGRAILRGLVTPERTVMVASTHRALTVPEKAKPGDGTIDGRPVLEAMHFAARKLVATDMQALAEANGSVISASLFGALAGSGALPFPRGAFEATIREGGVGVAASLAAFDAGFKADAVPAKDAPAADGAIQGGTAAERARLASLLERIDVEYPADAHLMLRHGVARLVDYQDLDYATEYLDHVSRLVTVEPSLAMEAARQVAVAMAYDDVIRVADLKTRAARIARVRADVQAGEGQVLDATEFMHPRVAEICGTLPARWGRKIEASPRLSSLVKWWFEKPRRVRTTRLWGFLQLYMVAGMRRCRRGLLRHARESDFLRNWLDLVASEAPRDAALALELLRCRRLVKGYSDTHARGESKFARVTAALPLLAGRDDAAEWLRRLREAALADEAGKALDGALATLATLERAA
jgi:indolepyruvate ferredoxin oxidoreductase, beta subunit